ncbi:hypothetical protein CMZ82_12405 [Lysobacteraceae bacterium NML93-0792]|nr:hypothetical protein CMZ82_12405 [Xanthomonadaceae bacterium NML93-0792]PBS16164.1 hypothetical protein CMZ81_07545 [Xanthomonadaceae bacterium NML93-0793]PBS20190.1 hypothetical protein CMZ80_04310 [Xanthomonadaceae bacterium NML93-0831]
MSAAVIPLHQVEPQLTPEHEDAFWSAYDALNAAQAAGDDAAWLDAFGLCLDWQMAVGLLTREEWRQHTAHMLPDAVRVLRSSPAGRAMLSQLRKDATANLKSPDYSERAGAALFLQASMPPKRKPAKKRAGPTRDELARSAYMAERIQGLVGALAFDEHKKSRMQHADDAREAYALAGRIRRLLGVRQ